MTPEQLKEQRKRQQQIEEASLYMSSRAVRAVMWFLFKVEKLVIGVNIDNVWKEHEGVEYKRLTYKESCILSMKVKEK